MQRDRRTVRRVVVQLRGLVDGLRRAGRDTLPTVAELARRLGVSKTSVSRAVAVLCSEGLLSARRGSGIRVVSPDVPVPDMPLRQGTQPQLLARWEQVRNQIVSEFLTRASRQDVLLPSVRALAGRYAASHRTVRCALQALVDSGRLRPQGERYVAAAVAHGGVRKSIVLVQLATSEGLPARRFPNEEQNLAWFGRECGERGIGVHTYLLSSGRSELLPFSPHVPRLIADLEESVLGVIAWLPGNAGSGMDVVLRSIRVPGRPVAVGARRTLLERFLHRPEHGPLRGFCTSEYGFDAGLAVGQYLHVHGHRHVLFMCPAGDLGSAEPERVTGMRVGLEQPGGPGRVDVHWYRRTPESHVPSANAAVGRNEFSELAARLEMEGALSDREQLIMRAVGGSGLLLRSRIRQLLLEEDLRRAFRQFSLPRSTTAIAAFNDEAALVCLKLLRERHIRVPEDVSLISFDDTADASLASVTSYNFNESQLLLSMLDWVLWPKAGKGPVIVPPPQGFVSERGTVATVRPAAFS